MALAAETEREGQFPMLNAGAAIRTGSAPPARSVRHPAALRDQRDPPRREHTGRGRMPEKAGSGERFAAFLDANRTAPGAKLLRESFDYGVKTLKLDPDTFAHELADGIIGDMYPVPGRMLRCIERIVHEYLAQEMCGGPRAGRFDLFAVEGGTAAMCYIFNSLMYNGLLRRGDTIALAVPTFQYIEIPHLDRYKFKVVNTTRQGAASRRHHLAVRGRRRSTSRRDKRIKAFFLVNQQSTSYAMRASSMRRLVKLVKSRHPNLMIVTDDVYGTFVPGFRSLMAEPAADHRGLLVLEALRVHRLAPRGRGPPPGQHLRQDDREAARQGPGGAPSSVRQHHADAGEDQVHRPHGRGQPRDRAQPHRRAVAAPADPDGVVLAVRHPTANATRRSVSSSCGGGSRGSSTAWGCHCRPTSSRPTTMRSWT